jgi:hypothetical protein
VGHACGDVVGAAQVSDLPLGELEVFGDVSVGPLPPGQSGNDRDPLLVDGVGLPSPPRRPVSTGDGAAVSATPFAAFLSARRCFDATRSASRHGAHAFSRRLMCRLYALAVPQSGHRLVGFDCGAGFAGRAFTSAQAAQCRPDADGWRLAGAGRIASLYSTPACTVPGHGRTATPASHCR